MKNKIKQIISFGIVGVIATVIDIGLLYLLKEYCHVEVLIANIIGFIVSLIVNYLLSMKFVFKAKEGMKKHNEFIIFCVISALGLGLNELIMYLGVNLLKQNYLLIKILATAIVMVFNFVFKKIFLEGTTKKKKGQEKIDESISKE